MPGRGLVRDAHLAAAASATGKAKGLRDRLDSHASGRRSGDQFCIYLCDRLVVPSLTRNQLQSSGDGTLLLDALTKRFVHDYLTYAYTVTDDGAEALQFEREIQRDGLDGELPRLNPRRR